MFGYTKPYGQHSPANAANVPQQGAQACRNLAAKETCSYKAHYCGLCFALSRQYGPLWRACANFDSTLLLLLMSAQQPDAPTLTKVFCPLGAPRRYCVIDGDELFMKIGSAFTVAMVDLKSQDAIIDGARAARPARLLGRRAFARAERVLAENHFDASSLDEIQKRQGKLESMAVENPLSVSFDDLAAPTGHGLAKVFEYTADLAGLRPNAEPLRRIGNAAGKIIYAADCLEDLETDLARGRFNGLAACSMVVPGTLILTGEASAGLKYLLDRCRAEIAYALRELETVRYRAIIENILLTSLPLRASEVLASRTESGHEPNHHKVDDIG